MASSRASKRPPGRPLPGRPPWSTTPTTRASSAGAGSLARPDDEALEPLEECLGHRFASRALLVQALTHTSRANELGDPRDGNERLEFLGDAVLDVAVSEILMREHPDRSEGWLTRARASAVNRRALAERARELDLGRWLRLGRSERRPGDTPNPSLLANALEAVVGALYLDAGLDAVRALVERVFGPHLADPDALVDPKTRLQELLQSRGEPTPDYRTTDESGPPHAREFRVEVRLSGRVLGEGAGRSKRAAEQAAARAALERGAS